MKIAEALIRFRNELNLTQKEIVERSGIPTVQQWQKYEYGQQKPSAEVIAKVARAFNVSADYLLGLSDEPYKKDYDDAEIKAAFALRDAIKLALRDALGPLVNK